MLQSVNRYIAEHEAMQLIQSGRLRFLLDLGAANCRLKASIKFCACAKLAIGSQVASSIENPFHLTCPIIALSPAQ